MRASPHPAHVLEMRIRDFAACRKVVRHLSECDNAALHKVGRCYAALSIFVGESYRYVLNQAGDEGAGYPVGELRNFPGN